MLRGLFGVGDFEYYNTQKKENNTKPNACAKKSLHGVPCRRGDLLVRVVGGKIYGCKGKQIWGRVGVLYLGK